MKKQTDEPQPSPESRAAHQPVWRRLAFSACALLLGFVAMRALIALRKPPPARDITEPVLNVEGVVAERSDFAVVVKGFAPAQPLNRLVISAEVAGRVTAIHERLEVGEVIPAGALLFTIDARDYAAARDEALAQVAMQEAALERLRGEERADGNRLEALERAAELARAEFERVRDLLSASNVGSRTAVDGAERAWIGARDQAAVLARAVSLYPAVRREAESRLAAAQAARQRALANLERCEVHAPFQARVQNVSLERDTYVTPGMPLLTLADDSMLELRVPLDGLDVRRWLPFAGDSDAGEVAWFAELEPVACDVRWTEDMSAATWTGLLHRVVMVSADTRTVTVAVRVSGAAARSSGMCPLVEGMFCEVDIPGRILRDVICLPRGAVSFEGTVYLDVDGRLRTADVEVARVQSDAACIDGGLAPGDRVITTRLDSPLDNTRVAWAPANGDAR